MERQEDERHDLLEFVLQEMDISDSKVIVHNMLHAKRAIEFHLRMLYLTVFDTIQ
jgi:hypothetical protein